MTSAASFLQACTAASPVLVTSEHVLSPCSLPGSSSIQDSIRSMMIYDAPHVIAEPDPFPNATLLSCYRPLPRALLEQAPPPSWPSNRFVVRRMPRARPAPLHLLQQNLTGTLEQPRPVEPFKCGASCKPAPDFMFLVE
jgi:hypothetical protein